MWHFLAIFLNRKEQLSENTLIIDFLNSAETNSINNFIQAILMQSKYILSYNSTERIKYEDKIIDLWQFIIAKYENVNTEESLKLIDYTSNLLCFIEELGHENTDLILKSCKRTRYFYSIIDDLAILQTRGNKEITSKYLVQVLLNLEIIESTYFTEEQTGKIRSMVEFLYQNKQKEQTNLFCEKMAKLQHHFLGDIFRKYN